jgi:hypothetical protein
MGTATRVVQVCRDRTRDQPIDVAGTPDPAAKEASMTGERTVGNTFSRIGENS